MKGRRSKHYFYKLVHYIQLDSNITYAVFIKKYGIKINSFQSPSFSICVKTNARTGNVRSLVPLTPLTRSAVLRCGTLTSLCSLACSVHRIAHSLRSLPRGAVEVHERVHAVIAFNRKKHVFGRHRKHTFFGQRPQRLGVARGCFGLARVWLGV